MDAQFCPRCGNALAIGDAYCSHCGNSVRPGGGINATQGRKAKRWMPWSLTAAALVLSVGGVLFVSRDKEVPAQAHEIAAPAAPSSTSTSSIPDSGTTAAEILAFTDSQLAERFGDAVYRIEVSGCSGAGSGTGFAIDEHHIVTNQHVVDEDIEPTIVHRDGTRFQGRVIGWQFNPDVAVIEVSANLRTTLDWAATSTLTVGDKVLGLGYPVPGTDFSAIPGTIISFDSPQGIRRAIRTDANWDRGNSGGPALTEKGEVAGVVTELVTSDGTQQLQNVALAFTPALLEGPVKDIIAQPTDLAPSCVGADPGQFEPDYVGGFDDYPDPYNPFWTAILMSVDYYTEDPYTAFDRAYEVLGLGLPADVLVSDDFPSLRPGYVVVYSGRFATAEEAAAWCTEIIPIVGSCYHRNVGWDSSYQ